MSWGQPEAQGGGLRAALVGPMWWERVTHGDATGTGCTRGSSRLWMCQDFTRAGADFLRISGVAVFEPLGREDAQLWQTPSWLPTSVLRQPRDPGTAPGTRSPQHCLRAQCHPSSCGLST